VLQAAADKLVFEMEQYGNPPIFPEASEVQVTFTSSVAAYGYIQAHTTAKRNRFADLQPLPDLPLLWWGFSSLQPYQLVPMHPVLQASIIMRT